MLCLESSGSKRGNRGEMIRRLWKSSHHDAREKRADRAPWLAAICWGSWTGLEHCGIDEHLAWHREPKSPTHCWGFPAFLCWGQYLEPRQPQASSTAQGQADHAKTKRKDLLGLVTKGSSWCGQDPRGATGSKAACMGGSCYWASSCP